MKEEKAVRWARAGYLAVLAAALLAPYEFRWDTALALEELHGAIRPHWIAADVVDAARNLTLLAGWGLLWSVGLRETSARRLLVGAVASAAAIGLAAEATQLALPTRTTSILDLATNAVGGGLGAGVGVAARRLLARERGRPTLLGAPLSAVAPPYLAASLLEVVFPLFRHAESPGRYGAPSERAAWALEAVGWDSLAVLPVTDALLLLPAGLLGAAALWERGFARDRAVRWTAAAGLAASVAGELAHAPLGRPVEMGPILVHAAAIAAGAWLVGSPWFPAVIRRTKGSRRTAGFLAAYALLLALWSWRPFVAELSRAAVSEQLAPDRWLPLGALRVRRDLYSVADVMRGFLLFVPVGAILAVRPLGRTGALRALWPAVILAAILEAGQVAVSGRFFDGTDAIVAAAGAGIAWLTVRAARFPEGRPILNGRSARHDAPPR